MRTHCLRASALLCFFVLAGAAAGDWGVASSKRESSPDESIEHWTTQLANAETNARATLHIALFQTNAATLRVVDQAETPHGDLAEIVSRTKALAGVNGGYFDPADAPVGLLVSEGKIISPLRKAKLLSGVLSASATRVEIARTARFAMSPKIKAAVQCGPLLIERGAPVAGLNDTRPARRTFAAVDGKGRAALGVCSAVSLAQLARILALTNAAGNFKISRALNLDGGSSSAFWFAGKEGNVSLKELKTVRNFVTIVPRSSR